VRVSGTSSSAAVCGWRASTRAGNGSPASARRKSAITSRLSARPLTIVSIPSSARVSVSSICQAPEPPRITENRNRSRARRIASNIRRAYNALMGSRDDPKMEA
jgi:hypothetical protein